MELLFITGGPRPAVRFNQDGRRNWKVRDLAVVIKQLTPLKGKIKQQTGILQKQDKGKDGQGMRTKKHGDATK